MSAGLATILLLQSGCATAMVRSGSERKPSPLYPATISDVAYAILPFVDLNMSGSSTETDPIRYLLLPGALIDLPISLCTDTLLLPYDILMLIVDD